MPEHLQGQKEETDAGCFRQLVRGDWARMPRNKLLRAFNHFCLNSLRLGKVKATTLRQEVNVAQAKYE